ncbi:hypothetical protein GLAREA_05242 [Glarea lozoyensis ATCC 20868]|uniref:Uncharacterized protein n=1 Tax=Glarea lozoyensis (strain ATCC 20868 / MF5171) TaxID=1116229 RepID=S3DFK7_GLAL2|nr:uncharacterized protein GLAREA_05242 [Glarea lozoyensis ATCC 20868]EPE35904.1 hypothetical protein GLAREA_05242 [Glarea lozoyensis ATCC 20868]
MDYRLKTPPSRIPPIELKCSSSTTHPSSIPMNKDPRKHYLNNSAELPPPLISSSSFIPHSMTAHLMRRKKTSALGVKFETRCQDEITDMEGALHTFVTPVVPLCHIVGDYRYQYGHGVSNFGVTNGKTLVRDVVMSASIHMDFETKLVMLAVCKLGYEEFLGVDAGEWEILGVDEKQDEKLRRQYDRVLRSHLVYHLTRDHRLPPRSAAKGLLNVEEAIALLEELISSSSEIGDSLIDKFVEIQYGDFISLELLINTAIQQARNEFSALEALCPQGYVYTYNPASIFAATIGPDLLNRLLLAAMRVLSDHNTFANMKVFAFNDYTDTKAVVLAKLALCKQESVLVASTTELFQGEKDQYDISKFAESHKATGRKLEDAMLVIHNNSDGFGQNIESEHASGSLDGAIGANSSAAASLKRDRDDLLDFMF